LDIERRLDIAGALTVRSRIFFDAWWLSASADGRAAHRPFWDEFWHFWRYNEHAEATPIAKGIIILRSNVMAHRSASLEYNDAFKRAQLRPMDMRRLTELALAVVNCLRGSLGKQPIEFDEIALAI
jgi:hypothetical protein